MYWAWPSDSTTIWHSVDGLCCHGLLWRWSFTSLLTHSVTLSKRIGKLISQLSQFKYDSIIMPELPPGLSRAHTACVFVWSNWVFRYRCQTLGHNASIVWFLWGDAILLDRSLMIGWRNNSWNPERVSSVLGRSLMIGWRKKSWNPERVPSVVTFVCVCLCVCVSVCP